MFEEFIECKIVKQDQKLLACGLEYSGGESKDSAIGGCGSRYLVACGGSTSAVHNSTAHPCGDMVLVLPLVGLFHLKKKAVQSLLFCMFRLLLF